MLRNRSDATIRREVEGVLPAGVATEFSNPEAPFQVPWFDSTAPPGGLRLRLRPKRLRPSVFFNIKRRIGRRWQGDDAFPHTPEFEEEFDLCPANDSAHIFHLGAATRAGGGITSPNSFDEGFPIAFFSVLLFRCGFWKDEQSIV
jgi:hypothetical protein